MELLISVRQSLTALDAVVAKIARAMQLKQVELWGLMLMAASNEAVNASWLGVQSGRSRQQLHRALKGLERSGFVAGVTEREKNTRWVLTDRGMERGRRLRAIVVAWEQMMTGCVDLQRLDRDLQRVVAALVNRPFEPTLTRGLSLPYEVKWGDLPIDGSAPLRESFGAQAGPDSSINDDKRSGGGGGP